MDDYITASDVASFIYCHRAWWLKLTGIVRPSTPTLEQGARQHSQLAVEVKHVGQRRRLGWQIVVVGLILLVALIMWKMAIGT